MHPRRNAAELFQSAYQGQLPCGYDGHGASALTRSAMTAVWGLFDATLSKAMHNKLRVYASLANGGDVHVTSLAQQVGVQLGLMQLGEQLEVAQLRPGGAVGNVIDAMFGLQHDIVCVQGLHHMRTPGFHSICWLVRQLWCLPGEHCEAFIPTCLKRPRCMDDFGSGLHLGGGRHQPQGQIAVAG